MSTNAPESSLITGDWVADWNLTRSERRPEGYFGGATQTQLILRPGGAWYLLHLLERSLARQDNGWNGAINGCGFFVSKVPDQFDKPVAKATFERTCKAEEVKCEPVQGRYVLLRALSEIHGGPWASVAELGVIGK